MSITITLSDQQKAMAWDEAERRQNDNEKNNRRSRNNGHSRGAAALTNHLYGAAGEIAVAKYLSLEEYLFLDKEPVKNSRDLPCDIDVKCRPNHDWDLLVQLDDDPTKNFVLVTAQNKQIRLQGWINGKDAMREDWIKEYVKGRPAYSVPQSELRSPESLKQFVDNQMHTAA